MPRLTANMEASRKTPVPRIIEISREVLCCGSLAKAIHEPRETQTMTVTKSPTTVVRFGPLLVPNSGKRETARRKATITRATSAILRMISDFCITIW